MPNQPKTANYRLWLETELTRRRTRNPAYSLRAFAGCLGLSPATLSQLLSGKRTLTQRSAEKIAHRLALDPEARDSLLGAVPKRVLVDAEGARVKAKPAAGERCLETEQFRMIADWYHLALLSLAKLPNCSAEPATLATRLGISTTEAQTALDRLKRLGFVRVRRGRLERMTKTLATTHDVPDAAIRRYHTQMLQLADRSLERDDVLTREFSALTLPADPKNLPKAKEAIRDFRAKLADLLGDGKPSRVYAVAMQLFPLEVSP